MPTTTHVSNPEPLNNAPSRRRKVKAVIAAGTVLGIGAMATLATWNDSEFAQGLFEAGTYEVVSSQDGETFSDHGTEGEAATLSFGDFDATNAAPGDEFAAGFWLRTTTESTYDGEISGINLIENSLDGQVENFRDVEVWDVTGGTCTTGDVDGTLVASGENLGELTSVMDTEIPLNNNDDAPGDAVELCFQVTAAGEDELQPGQDASATWQVLTQSEEQD